jgi:Rab-GTPase-TBC domain/Growth-Arrest-Specific Protein 2 Domain
MQHSIKNKPNQNRHLSNQNWAWFWDACAEMDVNANFKWDPNEITDPEQVNFPRNLLTSCLQLTRKLNARYDTALPDIVRSEIEIEELRRQAAERRKAAGDSDEYEDDGDEDGDGGYLTHSPSGTYKASPDDEIDQAVATYVNARNLTLHPQRLANGEYVFGTGDEETFIRLIKGVPLVRVKDQWVALEDYLKQHNAVLTGTVPAPKKARRRKKQKLDLLAQQRAKNAAAAAAASAATAADDDSKVEATPTASNDITDGNVVDSATIVVGTAIVDASATANTDTDADAGAAAGPSTGASVSTPVAVLTSDVKLPHDDAARQLAAKWMQTSGAADLKSNSPKSFEEYAAMPVHDELELDYQQIDKDVPRTTSQGFQDPQLRAFLEQMEQNDDHASTKLRRILQAFSQRNPNIGYVQGMSHIAYILQGFADDEEDAFWLLCASAENLHRPDFYHRALPTMKGFQVLSNMLSQMLDDDVKNHVGDSLNSLALKWWFDLFADSVPFNTMLQVWDNFFDAENGGDRALIEASMSLIENQRQGLLEAKNPIMYAVTTARSAEPIALISANRISQDRLVNLERSAVFQLEDEWKGFSSHFDRLLQQTPLTLAQLEHLIDVLLQHFSNPESENLVTADEFKAFLEEAKIDFPDCRALVRLYDREHAGKADFRCLVAALALLAQGAMRARMNLIFTLFNQDAHAMTQALMQVYRFPIAQQVTNDDVQEKRLVPYGSTDVVLFDDDTKTLDAYVGWATTQPRIVQLFMLTKPDPETLLIEGPKGKPDRGCCASCCGSDRKDGYEQQVDQDGEANADEESSCTIM